MYKNVKKREILCEISYTVDPFDFLNFVETEENEVEITIGTFDKDGEDIEVRYEGKLVADAVAEKIFAAFGERFADDLVDCLEGERASEEDRFCS